MIREWEALELILGLKTRINRFKIAQRRPDSFVTTISVCSERGNWDRVVRSQPFPWGTFKKGHSKITTYRFRAARAPVLW